MSNIDLRKQIFIPEYTTGKWGLPILCIFFGLLFIAVGVENREFIYKIAFIQTGILSIGAGIWIASQKIKQIEFDDQITIRYLWHNASYDFSDFVDIEPNNKMAKLDNRTIIFRNTLNFNNFIEIIEILTKNGLIQKNQFSGELKSYYKDFSLIGLLTTVIIAIGIPLIYVLFSIPRNIQSGILGLTILPYAFWIAYWVIRIKKQQN